MTSVPSDCYVITDANIITLDPGLPKASSMWVNRGRIEVIGDRESVRAAAGASVVDLSLGMATVMPGLVDSHCHLIWFGYLLSGANCSPDAAPSISAIQDLLSTLDPGPDGWIVGSGFAEYELEERRLPTRWELDAIAPDDPCVLVQTSLHVSVVNSVGLRTLGLEDDAPDPPGGWFGRGDDGRLDGRLYEGPTLDLLKGNVERYFDEVGPEGAAKLVEGAGNRLASLGVTSCSDASTDASSFSAMERLERTSGLPLRTTAMFTYPESRWLREEGASTGFVSDKLRIGAVKIWADGGMSSRTAAVDQPYLDPPGETGTLIHDQSALDEMIRECDSSGLQLAVHAQGERAIRSVLDAFATNSEPDNPLRHRIEHGGAFRPDLQELAADLQMHVVSQPGFISELGDGFIQAFGTERSQYLYPFASLARRGVLVAGSSDAPVVGPSPFRGMRDAVTRKTRDGQVLGSTEAVTMSEALHMYTLNGAFVSGLEDDIGSLEPGKLADFIVIDADPLESRAEALADVTVIRTVVGGRVVYDSGRLQEQRAR